MDSKRSELNYNISIHAPPRGATERNADCCIPGGYFNSRPSARGDSTSQKERMKMLFQFTPLREGRPAQGIS